MANGNLETRVSAEASAARERTREAAISRAMAHARALRIADVLIDGGFTREEIFAVTEFLIPYMSDDQVPPYAETVQGLTERGLDAETAAVFATAFEKA